MYVITYVLLMYVGLVAIPTELYRCWETDTFFTNGSHAAYS